MIQHPKTSPLAPILSVSVPKNVTDLQDAGLNRSLTLSGYLLTMAVGSHCWTVGINIRVIDGGAQFVFHSWTRQDATFDHELPNFCLSADPIGLQRPPLSQAKDSVLWLHSPGLSEDLRGRLCSGVRLQVWLSDVGIKQSHVFEGGLHRILEWRSSTVQEMLAHVCGLL